MTNIDHAALARDCLTDAEDADLSADTDDVRMMLDFANTHATLALADEQRTANQLAYAALLPVSSPTRKRILDDVGARLSGGAA